MTQFDQHKQQVARNQYNAEQITIIHQDRAETSVPYREVKAPVWNIPYPRNPVFTGRQDLLQQLAKALTTGEATALSQPQAISGLGGIGKTHIAVEYAYQHRQDYLAVLWTRADTREALISGYVEIVRELNLPQKDVQDQGIVVNALLYWLKTQTGWLLILDNADELAMVREFLPPTFGGHILLTTRAQSMGRLAKRLEVEVMDPEAGALLLLRRADLIEQGTPLEAASLSDIALAKDITLELGGLPLALDQAGAYIEEVRCSLSEYQMLYRTYRTKLLRERRGQISDHPEPVTTTWSLAFQKIEQQNAAAADLLRFCAFLAPDGIPEELILTGTEHLGPQVQPLREDLLAFHEALAMLGSYSLIHRESSTKTLSVHRLVQSVIREQMDERSKELWVERIVRAVNVALPPVEYSSWPQWERFLPHALACSVFIEYVHIPFAEVTHLLHQTGWYLTERVRYREAEPLLERALQISEQKRGRDHLDTARDATTRGYLYRAQGKYEQAQALYEQALIISEEHFGPQNPNLATYLNNLATVYDYQGKYTQAEPLYVRALSIFEHHLGPLHSDAATSLNNLALLYRAQGKYDQAEPLLKRALSIKEQWLGSIHPQTQITRENYSFLWPTLDSLSQRRTQTSLNFNNYSHSYGKRRTFDWFEWKVFMDEPPEKLKRVNSVKYWLHKTFPNPVRVVKDRSSCFALRAQGWGEFTISILIYLEDGREEYGEYKLDLSKPSGDLVIDT